MKKVIMVVVLAILSPVVLSLVGWDWGLKHVSGVPTAAYLGFLIAKR